MSKEITNSDLAQALLQLKGKPLDLQSYKPFKLIYDLNPPSLTACCGRQVGKSVSLASIIITSSIIRKFFTTLFISPLAQQTSRFSSQYLEPFMNSPIIKNHFTDSSTKKNVFLKTFTTGSSVILGYAETEQDADRIRGVAADQFNYDEVQDSSLEALPILEETLAASEFSYKRYTGTAKGEANTLTILFKRSNMLEWVVKCPSCNHYAIPNDFETCLKIISSNPNGPGCPKCGTFLDMSTGTWLAGKPSEKVHMGVHIPQFSIPARTTPKKWAELIDKAGRYTTVKLSNEVFGLPVGSGGRPLSLKEVKAVCNPSITHFDKNFPVDNRNILTTVLGVDWSVTGSTKSYTVASVLGYDYVGKAYLLYSKKFEGIDILRQVAEVIDIFKLFNCSHMASDRGVGVVQGQLMQKALGAEKVHMINYVAGKTNLRYDKDGNYFAADRTLNMDTMVIKTKMGPAKLECPSWEVMESFWEDALHLFEEETRAGRRVYRKDEDATDDFFHSLVFANIAYMILKEEFVYQDKEAVEESVFDF